MKSILITGANGMLGAALCNHFSSSKDFKIFAASRTNNPFVSADEFLIGDLTRIDFVRSLAKLEFDAVIHCAALTDIERCEREPQTAYAINSEATENLVKHHRQSVFIYISTDSVFDGKRGGYTEDDAPNPLNIYSKTKLLGEKFVSQSAAKHYILRTNMFGFHQPLAGRALFEWAYENLRRGNCVKGFSNVFFNPLYVVQLGSIIEKLINRQPNFGIYNAVSDRYLSKYEFVLKIAEKFQMHNANVERYEIPAAPVLAVRPFRTYLQNTKLTATFDDLDLSIDTGFTMLYKDFTKSGKQNSL